MNIDLARHGAEAAVAKGARLPAAHIRRVVIPPAHVLDVLSVGQDAKELEGMRAPTGDIAREFLEDEDGAFAPTKSDGVGHFGAWIVDGGSDALNRLIADE